MVKYASLRSRFVSQLPSPTDRGTRWRPSIWKCSYCTCSFRWRRSMTGRSAVVPFLGTVNNRLTIWLGDGLTGRTAPLDKRSSISWWTMVHFSGGNHISVGADRWQGMVWRCKQYKYPETIFNTHASCVRSRHTAAKCSNWPATLGVGASVRQPGMGEVVNDLEGARERAGLGRFLLAGGNASQAGG